MEDSCVCIDVDDPIEVISDDHPVARKEHKCMECGEQIRPGQKYERITAKFDGDLVTYKTCKICEKIRSEYFNCGWTYGSIYEDLAEAWGVSTELLLTGKDDDYDEERP